MNSQTGLCMSRPVKHIQSMAHMDANGYQFVDTDDVKVPNGGEAEKRTSMTGSKKNLRIKRTECCKSNLLLILTLCSVVGGFVVGFVVRSTQPSADTILILSFPGEIFMRMLKMLIVPLIVSSIVTGLASLDVKNSGKMGVRAILYYLFTSMVAVVLGIILVLIIHPGDPDNKSQTRTRKGESHELSSMDTILDMLRNLFPDNILQACFQQTKTEYIIDKPEEYVIESKNKVKLMEDLNSTLTTTTVSSIITTNALDNSTNQTIMVIKEYHTKWVRSKAMGDGVNVLGLITFFTAFGIYVSNMGHQAKLVIDLFNIINDIIMNMVQLVMWFSPVGIMSLILGKMLGVADLAGMASQLGMYMLTVLLGLAIHFFIILPGIYFAVVRKNPYRVTLGLIQAFLTVLGTSSSVATLPVTLRCLEDGLNFDPRVTRFVLPIGSTINMDGTALYEAVAPIFIAQLNDIPLTFGTIVIISLTATCASVGAASIPSAGLITMVLVLTSAGLPLDDLGLILTVDWFLDRFRTMTNVLGDSYGAAIVEHLCSEELRNDHHKEDLHMKKDKEMEEHGI